MAHSITDGLSAATLTHPDAAEIALCRATIADRATDAADCAQLLAALGLDAEAGPRVRLRDLPWRPDHHLTRVPGAPAATAPDSPAVIRARAAAKQRRRDVAANHLRSQGLSGTELRSALARMKG